MYIGDIIHQIYKYYGVDAIERIWIEPPYNTSITINGTRYFIECDVILGWAKDGAGMGRLDTLRIYEVVKNIKKETSKSKALFKMLTENCEYYEQMTIIASVV
jgi:hypothetical protein